MFHRIADHTIVSLEESNPISRIVSEADEVVLHFRDGAIVTVGKDQEEYVAYLSLIATAPLLICELQLQSLRSLRHQHTHPLMDEMPPTLFTIFQSLPYTEQMELRLLQSGAGELWRDGRCILSWHDFTEGLTLLMRQHTGLPV